MTTCDLCGRAGDDTSDLTWTTSWENGRRRRFCEVCSRENVRSMEAKLDSEHW